MFFAECGKSTASLSTAEKFIMKKLLPLFVLLFIAGCEKEPLEEPYVPFVYTDSVTDSEGNVYHTVQIGGQVWMAENLRSTRYNNGDTITFEEYSTDWCYPLGGGICFYDNDSLAESIYGKIYNFHAVNDPRGLAPPGWHIPSYYELIGLVSYLGPNAGNKLREHGTKHWIVPNGEATDEYGFRALPGGWRNPQCDFESVRNEAYFWSSTHWLPSTPGYPEAWHLQVVGDKDPILAEPEHALEHAPYITGCYIRCIKD